LTNALAYHVRMTTKNVSIALSTERDARRVPRRLKRHRHRRFLCRRIRLCVDRDCVDFPLQTTALQNLRRSELPSENDERKGNESISYQA
jgi:hypothetical protein